MENPYLASALAITQAQAATRHMTEEEITSMVKNLTASLRAMDAGQAETVEKPPFVEGFDASTAIKAKTITCGYDGQAYKQLSKRTLAKFGATPDSYRALCGYPKNLPLACKELTAARRKRLKENPIWQQKKGKVEEAAPAEAVSADY